MALVCCLQFKQHKGASMKLVYRNKTEEFKGVTLESHGYDLVKNITDDMEVIEFGSKRRTDCEGTFWYYSKGNIKRAKYGTPSTSKGFKIIEALQKLNSY
jgi:hypothetical protein